MNSDDTLLLLTILGYLALAIIALCLNDAAHRFATQHLRDQQERIQAHLMLVIDALVSSSETLLARHQQNQHDIDGLRQTNFELQVYNDALGTELQRAREGLDEDDLSYLFDENG